jgi:hypothetical protein
MCPSALPSVLLCSTDRISFLYDVQLQPSHHDSSVFYIYSISEHDEQNVLNFKVALFCLKWKTATEQLSVTDLVWGKSNLHAVIDTN